MACNSKAAKHMSLESQAQGHSSHFETISTRTLREEILASLDDQIEHVLSSLPRLYFESLPEQDQLSHLKALIAFNICDIQHEIMLRSADNRIVTVISRENYPGYLANIIRRLPTEHSLVGAKICTSRGKRFIVDRFEFQTDAKATVSSDPSEDRANLVATVSRLTEAPIEAVTEFVERYHPTNEILRSPDEIARQFAALQEVEHNNDIAILWDHHESPAASEASRQFAKVTVSAGNATTRAIFQRGAEFFAEYDVDIDRALCENIRLACNNPVALATFHVSIELDQLSKLHRQFGADYSPEFNGDVLKSQLATFMRVDEEVVTNKAVGEQSLTAWFGDPRRAELFCALARLTHHVIEYKQGRNLSRERIFRSLIQQDKMTRQVLDDVETRFDSQQSSSDHQSLKQSPRPRPEFEFSLEAVTDGDDRFVARIFQEVAESIQQTNLYVRDRRSVTFRLPGSLFNDVEGETPFAIFYVYGQGFDGFHVRFRDVARGGMRLVRTRNEEHYLFESSRLFDEAYQLAFAQQLKNKDIAEGGAKAVVLLRPHESAERVGRDFVDGLLDVVSDAQSPEYLYLGPDENVTNELIEWIVSRARERGYLLPETLMSSKPAIGINHKEFGVTSEGVVVFLRRALLEYGFDPDNAPFTVKMTGGPDGDVGGNAIRILIRDYGVNANIVAIADGSGAAHDPDGLDHNELMRLVDHGLGIANFDPVQLGKSGVVGGLETEQQVAWRNNLYFTAEADVFVPAGGRPSTINEDNWRRFLRADGSPTSSIIVEGANLFVSVEARQHLARCGVAIVKDSSANKCGVICSSLEILASMLLTETEFLAIRGQYIEEVLVLLRQLAATEANCLFNEHSRHPEQTLPEISVSISQQINRVADVISRSFVDWSEQERHLADELMLAFLPASLAEAIDFVSTPIPASYLRQLVSAILASRVVYREGRQNVCNMTEVGYRELVRDHLTYESQTRDLVEQLRSSNLAGRDKLIAIIDHAGSRSQRELRLD